jgi:hypothetical protein
MNIKNPCIHSDNDAWCKNKNIKRSLFGIGARCCVVYTQINKSNCKYYEAMPKPKYLPPKGGSGVINRPIKIELNISQNSK